jgi:hypothetical protein
VLFLCGSQCLTLEALQHFLSFHNWIVHHSKTVDQLVRRSNSFRTEQTTKIVAVMENSRRQFVIAPGMPAFFMRCKYFFFKFFNSEYSIDYCLYLISRQSFQATDQRDLVYAFMGLSKFTSGIVPDYCSSNTIWDVNIKITKVLLQASSTLTLLRRAVETKTRDSDQKLLSWVPDWIH